MNNQSTSSAKESIKYWYLPLIVGIFLIGGGIKAFISPDKAFLALNNLLSYAFLVIGVIEILFAFSNKNKIDNWGWVLVLGIITTLIGILLLSHPEVSLISLALYVGFILLFRSFGAMAMAIDLRSYGEKNWVVLMIISVLGIIFSFILIWNPKFVGMTFVFWIGLSLISTGFFSVLAAFRMKNLHKNF
ncbi:DUF308 domain-containing protein [Aquimarina sp. D1M17]|uniref:HdeD family acid-resistance protein n=1 Tax=Aquimarina acroporae TaxID=2937283 RepID=UPI0020BE4BD5|nr:DUF308 domain-containing protein [Aquimarina acroporae]MCK8521809.1 DUF308 domain-containing protein [Aquimarina acroporae]